MVTRSNRSATKAFTTKDGSTVRELMHPKRHASRHQSLAEARVPPGAATQLHQHFKTEELYYFLQGRGEMTLGSEVFPVAPGDVVCIIPGTPHMVENTGIEEELVFLCCCAPAYSDQDTVLLDRGK